MSGGSYDYIYQRLEVECQCRMYDPEMDMLIEDLCKVLHDLEWWQSGDYSEEEYRKAVGAFKKKWLKGDKVEVAKSVIDSHLGMMKRQFYSIFEISEGESE